MADYYDSLLQKLERDSECSFSRLEIKRMGGGKNVRLYLGNRRGDSKSFAVDGRDPLCPTRPETVEQAVRNAYEIIDGPGWKPPAPPISPEPSGGEPVPLEELTYAR